jgi:hypothetical protein
MDIPNPIGFSTAFQRLKDLARHVSFTDAESNLNNLMTLAQSIRTFQKLDIVPEIQEPNEPFDPFKYVESGFYQLMNELPIQDNGSDIQESLFDYGFPPIWPEAFGSNAWCWDTFAEACENPDSYTDESGLRLFLICIANDELDGYSQMREYFRWPWDSIPGTIDVNLVDWGKVRRRMKAHHLDDFFASMQVMYDLPHNIFFNFQCDEGYMDDPIELNVENINFLRKEWKRAKPLVDACDIAGRKAFANPLILEEVVKVAFKWDPSEEIEHGDEDEE